MPRFVVLVHDHPFVHWDLLLESAGVARTWRWLESPERLLSETSLSIVAEPIADHRLMYLDYEGEVSRERGRVTRWDYGTFEWLDETLPIRVRLNGERLKLELALSDGLAECRRP